MNHQLRISLSVLLLDIRTSNNSGALSELSRIYGGLNRGRYRAYKLDAKLGKILITLFAHLQLILKQSVKNNTEQVNRYKHLIQNSDALILKKILKTHSNLVTKIK